MMFAKGLACLLVLVGCVYAQDYSDDQSTGEQNLSPNYSVGYGRQGYHQGDVYETGRAEPYDFGFQSTDEFGTIMNRQESSDSNGAVRGSYGYTDPFGVFRHVDYVADEFGFRAEVKSNEPGMGTQSPANVQIYAEPPPAGVIVERPYYHPHGQASSQQPTRRNPNSGAGGQAGGAGSASGAGAGNRQAGGRSQSGGARSQQSASATRTSVYPTYVAPQQSAFATNSLSSNQQQYPPTLSNQYAANVAAANAAASASSSNNQYTSGSQYSHGSTYQSSAYPARSPYGSQGYATLSGSQGSSSAGSAQKPIVAKPYDGPTYKVGNPHITEYKSEKHQQSGTYLLPTVIAAGNAPTTLVKHIHIPAAN